MKTAQQYVDAADTHSICEPAGMAIEDAIVAVQAALDDAAREAANREQYKDLLAMAIINSQPQPKPE